MRWSNMIFLDEIRDGLGYRETRVWSPHREVSNGLFFYVGVVIMFVWDQFNIFSFTKIESDYPDQSHVRISLAMGCSSFLLFG